MKLSLTYSHLQHKDGTSKPSRPTAIEIQTHNFANRTCEPKHAVSVFFYAIIDFDHTLLCSSDREMSSVIEKKRNSYHQTPEIAKLKEQRSSEKS